MAAQVVAPDRAGVVVAEGAASAAIAGWLDRVAVRVGRRVTTRVGVIVGASVAVGGAVGDGVAVEVGIGVSVGTRRANLVGSKERATRVGGRITSAASERLAGAHPAPNSAKLATTSARKGKGLQRTRKD